MGYEGLKATFYFILWKSTDGIVNDSAAVIEVNSRYTADIVLRSCLGRDIHVNPGKFDLSCIPRSQFIQNRRLSSAMASPGGREFDEDRPREGLYFRSKVPVRYINGSVEIRLCRGKPCAALSADTLLSLFVGRDAVPGSTLRTTDDYVFVHKNPLAVRNEKPRPDFLAVPTYFMPHNISHISLISIGKCVYS